MVLYITVVYSNARCYANDIDYSISLTMHHGVYTVCVRLCACVVCVHKRLAATQGEHSTTRAGREGLLRVFSKNGADRVLYSRVNCDPEYVSA